MSPPSFDWQAVLDVIADSVAVYDADDKLIAWNRAFTKAWGTDGESLRHGMTRAELALGFARKGHFGDGDPATLAAQRMASTLETGDGAEVEINEDGQARRVRRFAMEDGGLVFLRTEANEQVRIRGQLDMTSDILKTVFETLDQPACVWDSNHCLVAWNEAFAHMTGVPPEDMSTGMHALEFLKSCAKLGYLGPGDPEALAQARYNTVWGEPGIMNDIVERAGRIYDAHRSELPAGGFLTIFNDVTDREHSARELLLAKEEAEQANAVKTHFLANMSHELRTPLNAIMGFSDLMIHSRDLSLPPDRIRDYAHDIRDSAVLLLEIINDLLDLAKIETGRFEISKQPADLHQAVTSGLNLIRHMDGAETLTFENNVAEDFPRCWVDEMAFGQILLNLLSNAVKATPDGGTIGVKGMLIDDGFSVSVSDTGSGIPEEALENVFDPYESARNSYVRAVNSTGLGLSIVKRLMELHGGEVRIDSEAGKGTTVILTFPLS